MKAIHGGKAKNDRIDAQKIAVLLRGGMIPQVYVYPPRMRSTRDMLRRRLYLIRKRGQLLAHILNTNHQYNLPEIGVEVKCAKESAGKKYGTGGRKIGNVHLKWAFSEAAVLFLRKNVAGQKYPARLAQKHGKGKALTILAHKLGRSAYYMMTRRRNFNMRKFLAA